MHAPPHHDDKVCPACGRAFEWRAKWARTWDTVVFCSKSCRSRGERAEDPLIEAALMEAVRAAGRGARLDPERWAAGRWEREDLRSAVRRLVHRGSLHLWSRGKRIEPEQWRGAGEVRLAR